jgi:hypothetical protein
MLAFASLCLNIRCAPSERLGAHGSVEPGMESTAAKVPRLFTIRSQLRKPWPSQHRETRCRMRYRHR